MKNGQISDELLCAYHDHELNKITRDALQKQLQQDPRLQRRLDDIAEADRLLNSVLGRGFEVTNSRDKTVKSPSFSSVKQAAALIAASVAGLIVGLNLAEPDSNRWQDLSWVIQLESQSIFQQTMETQLSGVKVHWSNPDHALQITPIKSYKTKQGFYCRQFLLSENLDQITGKVCRDKQAHWGIVNFQYNKLKTPLATAGPKAI